LWLIRCQYGPQWLETHVRKMLLAVSRRFDSVCATLSQSQSWTPQSEKVALASFIVTCLHNAYLLAVRAKHAAFKEEQEYRLVAGPMPGFEHVRASTSGLVPYIPLTLADEAQLLNISKIYVGPTQDSAVGVSAAAGFVSGLGYPGSIVEPSQVPYRSKNR
jgi:hypothetical protein